ncbi:MAG: class I SAM-dependent RNA methyltransferase [Burkholderiales bacterium]|nr:class I SAM-dependent RNA methyltransferase [Burkholderiales bacterium]
MSAASLFLPCAGGVEALLAAEATAISGSAAEVARGGVWVAGDERAAMQLNLESRLAQRVLWPLIDGPYRDEHDLYALARRVDWARWITPAQTLRVDVTAQRSPLTSLNFAALRIKDAVCDVLRERSGERPSVDTRHPDLPIALFVGPEHAMLYVDTSGEALFKRGWREDTGEAPLKETLAAAMLAAAGWQGRAGDGPLFDPCCGAGTIAIEAAQIACGIAPGSQRRFAFERLQPFKPFAADWRALQAAAQARVHASAVPIYAGDVSFRMTDFSARNAERAGVREAIEFKTADALQRPPPAAAGTLMLNPPYGERIAPKGRGAAREAFDGGAGAGEFFAALAAHWKHQYAGWRAWVLSPEMKLPTLMRLKESARVPLWNGGIECRLFRFDMVRGAGPGRSAPAPGPKADQNL